MNDKTNSKIELRKIFLSMVIPISFVFLFWIIYIIEISLNIQLSQYGLRARDISQWFGVLTMPFLHGSLEHILSNTVSFIVLGSLLFYFYNNNAIQIFVWIYIFSGILTWIIARGSVVHIGASGMIYAFAGYIFTAGVISKNIRNMAISLIVVFLYGSMIWGIFPMKNNISWEGHLAGFVVGITIALMYIPIKRKEQEKIYCQFDDCPDSSDSDEIEIKYFYDNNKKENYIYSKSQDNSNTTENDETRIKYLYKNN